MIWFSIIDNAAGAAKYFTPDGRDYHVEDERTYAFFGGKAAEKLGLGDFDLDQFKRMLYGQHPTEDHKLTVGAKRATNRCGYEVIFDGPKDLSVLWGLGEARIPGVMEQAMRETLDYIEADAKTRVRVGKQDRDRTTGNIAYAAVLHVTGREEKGKVDQHLHYHVLLPNATFDPVEKKWKALQLQAWEKNGEKLDRPRYVAFYHARLAHHVLQLGYEVEKTKDAFRVVGLDDTVRGEFCQRTRAIKEKEAEIEAEQRKARDNPGYKLSRKQKAKLGAIYREPKQPGRSMDSLVEHWESRLTPKQLQGLRDLIQLADCPVVGVDRSAEAVRYAMEHLTYRKSQIDQREVMLEALRFDPTAVTPAGVVKAIGGPGIIRRERGGVTTVTSAKAVNQEKAIVQAAIAGRGRCRPFAARADPDLFDRKPTNGQFNAVEHLLTSSDKIMVWVGKAGAGKSTALKAARRHLDQKGVPMQVVAPTIGASRDGDLRHDFSGIETVSAYLRSEEMQERLRGGLLVIDEIGMLGVADFARVSQSADRYGYRVLVVGDDKQHLAPVRGDVLGLLKDKSGVPVVELSEILRQRGKYAEASAFASRHDTLRALGVMEEMGWVREGVAGEMIEAAADAYLDCRRGGETAVICSPTHRQGAKVVEAVRQKLREADLLTGPDEEFTQLVPLYLSPAQLEEAKKSPEPGIVYQRYDAYRPGTISLAVGDSIRLLGGGMGADGKKLENGWVGTVTGFRDGNIEALSEDGRTKRLIGGDFGKLQHAYYTTSLGVQSKTRNVSIMPQTADAYPAMGARQFYVDMSRGDRRAILLTDSLDQLRRVIQRDQERPHAIDLVRQPKKGIKQRLRRHVAWLRSVANRGKEFLVGQEIGIGRDSYERE